MVARHSPTRTSRGARASARTPWRTTTRRRQRARRLFAQLVRGAFAFRRPAERRHDRPRDDLHARGLLPPGRSDDGLPLGGGASTSRDSLRGVEKTSSASRSIARPVEELLVRGRALRRRAAAQGAPRQARRAVAAIEFAEAGTSRCSTAWPAWRDVRAGALLKFTTGDAVECTCTSASADGLSERGSRRAERRAVQGGPPRPQQTVFVSIPSLLDPGSRRRDGTPWILRRPRPSRTRCGRRGRRSEPYKALKAERGAALWRAIERFGPDIARARAVTMVGSPLDPRASLRDDDDAAHRPEGSDAGRRRRRRSG